MSIAQGDHQDKTSGVADLREGHDGGGRARTHVKGEGDLVEERLAVVEIGDHRPSGYGHK